MTTNERHLPTEQEWARIRKMAVWRNRLFILIFCPTILLVFGRLLPDNGGWTLTILAGTLTVIMLGLLAYVSFFLRCPRCASWTGAAVPKCASCGLKYQDPAQRNPA